MIDRFGSDFGSTGGFCKNEGTLQHRLSVQRQAASGPSRLDTMCFDGSGYIRFDLRGVIADRMRARIADCRMAVVGFLYHRAYETRELRHSAGQNCLAEVDVAQHAVEWILIVMIWRRCEESVGHLRPVIGGRDRQIVLALEMMKEGALGDVAGRTKIVYGRCRVALGSDHHERGVENLVSRRLLLLACRHVRLHSPCRLVNAVHPTPFDAPVHKTGDVQGRGDDADAVANDLGGEEESVHCESPLGSAHLLFGGRPISRPHPSDYAYRLVGMLSMDLFLSTKPLVP